MSKDLYVGPKRCEACEVYEATVNITFMNATQDFCHSCLVAFRREMKEEFKRSEATRPKPPKRVNNVIPFKARQKEEIKP